MNSMHCHSTRHWLKTHIKHSVRKGKSMNVSPSQLSELRRIFKELDHDSDGIIRACEMKRLFSRVRMEESRCNDAMHVIERFGKMSFKRFVSEMTALAHFTPDSLQEERRASSAYTQFRELSRHLQRLRKVKEIHLKDPTHAAYQNFSDIFSLYSEGTITRNACVLNKQDDLDRHRNGKRSGGDDFVTEANSNVSSDERWKRWRRARFRRAQNPRRPHFQETKTSKSLTEETLKSMIDRSQDAELSSKAADRDISRSLPRFWTLARTKAPFPLKHISHETFAKERERERDRRAKECSLRQHKMPGKAVRDLILPLRCTALGESSSMRSALRRPELLSRIPRMELKNGKS